MRHGKRWAMNKSDKIRYAVKELGGALSVAKLCGLNRTAVYMWATNGRIPPQYLELLRSKLPDIDIGLFNFRPAP